MPLTLGFCVLFAALQVWASASATGAALRESGLFSPRQISWSGFWLSPVFHASFGHFLANWVGFLVCAGWLETALGSGRLLLALAPGFWLSNPVTAWVLMPVLRTWEPTEWMRLLAETDNGASNGIYSVVGALAGCLARPGTLIGPFIFNGLLYALVSREWLATQHVLALFMGFWVSRIPGWLPLRRRG